jgi:hypothetical protein
MMPRPQFSIRTLLWLTLVVAAFLGGICFERELERRRHYTSDLEIPISQGSFSNWVATGDPTPDNGGRK